MRIDSFILRLNDKDLLAGLKKTTSNERKIQCQFLIYLAEVEKRRLYAVEGHPSLFKFVTEALGHSESSASKRIWVARRARQFPQIYYALEEGKVSLTALSKLCPHLNSDNIDTFLSEAEHKSVREVEKILARYFPKEEVRDRVSPLSSDRVHIHFTADQEFAENLEKAKALLSHKYPQMKLCDIFGEALRLLLSKKDSAVRQNRRVPAVEEPGRCVSAVEEPDSQSPNANTLETQAWVESERPAVNFSRHIPRKIRTHVWKRDGGKCTYVSPSGKKCDGRAFLEYDHAYPWILGGRSDSPENVRLLCRAHNRLMAEQVFGRAWMERKIEDQNRFCHAQPGNSTLERMSSG